MIQAEIRWLWGDPIAISKRLELLPHWHLPRAPRDAGNPRGRKTDRKLMGKSAEHFWRISTEIPVFWRPCERELIITGAFSSASHLGLITG